LILAALLSLTCGVLVACGGGGDDDDGDGTSTPSGTRTSRSATARTGTAAAGTATPAATPEPGTTAAAVATSVAEGTPAPPGFQPAEGEPPPTDGEQPPPSSAGGTPLPRGQATDAEATLAAELGENVTEGQTNEPEPPPGASVDPPTLGSPDPPGGFAVHIDLNASEPGIQTSRDIAVGDVIRVAVVIADYDHDIGALNFVLKYDKSRLFAPTITGGPPGDRNPDFNQSLGGALTCFPPAAVGDLGDQDLGDSDPNTGEAFLSCFTGDPATAASGGSVVLATVEFHATSPGSSELSLVDFAIAEAPPALSETGSCNPVIDVPVDCRTATVTVR
jgi:hypothetical protein